MADPTRRWLEYAITEQSEADGLTVEHKPTGKTSTFGPGTYSVGELNGVQQVRSVDDLPDPDGGAHVLDGESAYYFTSIVASPYSLDPNGSAVLGHHGSASGFIHTGGGVAVESAGAPFLSRSMYYHAPGGVAFDLSASITDEFLFQDSSVSDAAGLGDMASLGTIEGFRVPSIKGCNFEDFASGLTFAGTCEKIFVQGSPFRGVSNSGVTILTFDSELDVAIVDMPNNYVKGVQADTEVIRVEAGGSPTEVFQYRGTTHDVSVTKSNILNGEASSAAVGYRVSNSYPLRESAVVGEAALDAETTTAISAQDTYTAVEGATSLGDETERVAQASPGVLEYMGKKDTNVQVSLTATVQAPSNESFAIVIGKNGTPEPTSEARAEGQGNAPTPITATAVEDLQTGDTIQPLIKNIDSATDIDVVLYNLNFSGL